eukprot:12754814-Alexandrium_andersonii.AAC.1
MPRASDTCMTRSMQIRPLSEHASLWPRSTLAPPQTHNHYSPPSAPSINSRMAQGTLVGGWGEATRAHIG